MITTAQCRANATECEWLGKTPDISKQRATSLMVMAHGWDVLGDHTARYEAIVIAETKHGLPL